MKPEIQIGGGCRQVGESDLNLQPSDEISNFNSS